MPYLGDYLPTYTHDVLKLPIEELAVYLLRFLRRLESEDEAPLRMRAVVTPSAMKGYVPESFGYGEQIRMSRRLAEVWNWVETNGFLAPDPQEPQGCFFLTERGRALTESPLDASTYAAEFHLPSGSLLPKMEEETRPDFLRGAYDKAVFSAMRLVEIEVRAAAGLDASDIGVPLMRKAFHPDKGVLADTELPVAERQRVADLFAGAIGAFKNPASHREVDLADPAEAANLIRLADQLLRMVHRTNAYGDLLVERTMEIIRGKGNGS